VPVYHVRFTCAADYLIRRLPFRPAHLKQLAALREDGRVVAGGPEPDGTAADIFYRVPGLDELDRVLAENEFYRAGLFIGHDPRRFADFVEPLDAPPVDAGLATEIVAGVPTDADRARSGLARLQREGRAAFGGFFADGSGLAVIRSPRGEEAIQWMLEAGGWAPPLATRDWSQTL
jgi:hypothetical protein